MPLIKLYFTFELSTHLPDAIVPFPPPIPDYIQKVWLIYSLHVCEFI